jgi:hypothetical protein
MPWIHLANSLAPHRRIFPQGDGNERNNINPASNIPRMWTILSEIVDQLGQNLILDLANLTVLLL